jgi:hypothetical protein
MIVGSQKFLIELPKRRTVVSEPRPRRRLSITRLISLIMVVLVIIAIIIAIAIIGGNTGTTVIK